MGPGWLPWSPDINCCPFHSARPGSPGGPLPPGVRSWTLPLSLLSNLCCSKSQEGDLEKRRLLPGRRVPIRLVVPSAAVFGPWTTETSALRSQFPARQGVGPPRTPQLRRAPCSLMPAVKRAGISPRRAAGWSGASGCGLPTPDPRQLVAVVALTGVYCPCPPKICLTKN